MGHNLTLVSGQAGISMLACRHHELAVPAEHQQWGGVAPESLEDERDILSCIRDCGLVAVEFARFDSGISVTTVVEQDFSQLHEQFGYVVQVAPRVGKDIIADRSRTGFALPDQLVADATDIRIGLDADKWAFCVIKPDAKSCGMEGEIAERISERQLRIVSQISNHALVASELDQLWPAPLDDEGNPLPPSPWWAATVDYMMESPVDLMLVHGADASRKMKQLKAELRAELYGTDYQQDPSLSYADRVRSVIHTSDCNTELITNVGAFWDSKQLHELTYKED